MFLRFLYKGVAEKLVKIDLCQIEKFVTPKVYIETSLKLENISFVEKLKLGLG